MFLCGFENPTTRFIYKIPQLIWISPFVYGQQITNYSYGEGIYCENYEFYKAEKSTLAMDAIGSLLFSDSDTSEDRFIKKGRDSKSISNNGYRWDDLCVWR